MKSFDIGGSGPVLHFLHANGYPPNCYAPLFELLKKEYNTHGMLLRPLWDDARPDDIQSWHPFSDDLLRFLSDRGSGPVIGVGHSIGAVVTLRAALHDPGKFSALVLIDPVLFIPPILFMWKVIRAIGLEDRTHPLIAGAKKRRRTFDNLETVFRGYRTRNIFRYMNDESLRSFIEGMTKPDGDGYKLVYSPEWEAQIYRTAMQDMDIWNNLPKLEVPTLIIRGTETDTFLRSAARLVRKKQPKVKVEALERSTHLIPLEKPDEVCQLIKDFLQHDQGA